MQLKRYISHCNCAHSAHSEARIANYACIANYAHSSICIYLYLLIYMYIYNRHLENKY